MLLSHSHEVAGGWQCLLILTCMVALKVSRVALAPPHWSPAHLQRAGVSRTVDHLPESCWEGLFGNWGVAGLQGNNAQGGNSVISNVPENLVCSVFWG